MRFTGEQQYPRHRQECRNLFQDLSITHVGIVEAGSINEDHPPSVDDELIGELDLGGA